MVSATNQPELARALQRYGDELYRLALLLGRDERQAARAMLLAARRLAQQPTHPDEPGLIRALVAALPNEPARPPRRLPRWAVPPPGRDDRAALMGALLHLPRPARLALGLSILRTFEPRQVAVIAGGDEAGVRAQLRDALLALAPHAPITIAPGILSEADAPEACRPTRAALALADPARLADPAVRGHLALCSSCRAADLAWSQLTAAVEEALRGALRDVGLPAELDDDLQAAVREPNELGVAHWLARPRVRIALVTLPVLALIAFLVWPRGAPALPTGGVALPAAATPGDLVRRAQTQLYTPPAGTAGVWHAQYAMQWFFPDGSFAQLNAGEWDDPAGGRHRLQLVHHSGGGPYEFELANGTESVWYAASENYAGVLYPLGANGTNLRARFTATPAQREQMRAARLESGPWALAAHYLRQAAGAELRTWGRQRDPDGRLLQLISFPGVSPLALQPDAPDATTSRVTVLLTIDETSGRLREVRELFGAADAEQTARTTWQVTSEETIADAEAANRAFDQSRAWNGVGSFADQGALLSPLLPLIEKDSLVAPEALISADEYGLWLPDPAPAGTAALALTSSGAAGPSSTLVVQGDLTALYVGGGRQLALRSGTAAGERRRFGADETLSAPGRQTLLKALPNQGYRALVVREAAPGADALATQVSAVGYTRAELLALLETLSPPSLGLFRQQAVLVIEPLAHDAAWQALFGALAEPPQPPAGGARYFVEQVFKRQLRQPDPLADPYHRPPYGGWPEQVLQHNWARGTAADRTLETAALTLDAGGVVVARQFRSAAASWDYDAPAGRVVLLPGDAPGQRMNEDQYTVLRLLTCGGATVEPGANATRRVILADTGWQNRSCAQPHYPVMWARQRTVPAQQATDGAPYLADLANEQLTTVVDLGADGRAVRTQVWAGQPGTGVLLESWERVSEALLAPDQIPAEAFSAQPPAARLQARYLPPDQAAQADAPFVSTATLTDALALARSPLFGFAPGPGQPALVSLEAATPPGGPALLSPLQSSVFDSMLAEGYATRSVYSANTGSGFQLVQIYQGDAAELGAYLRAQAHWARSEPQSITIGGQPREGWNVTELPGGLRWLVFEHGGALIAVQSPGPELLPVLDQLVRLERGLAP